MTRTFRERIASAASEKNSRIVLALDPPPGVARAQEFAEKMISVVHDYVCSIKINFHLVLPLSGLEIAQINRLAHSFGLQSIADIKLNDIVNTNSVAVDHLVGNMGFDAIIANPIIGQSSVTSLVKKAHSLRAGAIALVYMSQPDAREGYGLEISDGRKRRRLYEIFLERASRADADGIVIGATRPNIVKQAVKEKPAMPVYSPGIGAQGGDAVRALRSGSSYLIVGRTIVESKDPAAKAREMQISTSSLPVRN